MAMWVITRKHLSLCCLISDNQWWFHHGLHLDSRQKDLNTSGLPWFMRSMMNVYAMLSMVNILRWWANMSNRSLWHTLVSGLHPNSNCVAVNVAQKSRWMDGESRQWWHHVQFTVDIWFTSISRMVIFQFAIKKHLPETQIAPKTMIWLVVWNMCFFSIQLGMSSFQLTNSYFSEG